MSTKNTRPRDKIFDNTYKTGEGLKGQDYTFSQNISIKSDYCSKYLRDVYEYEDYVEYKIILDRTLDFIKDNPALSEITAEDNSGQKKKFNSAEINLIFGSVYDTISKEADSSKFLNPIYLVEAISKITGLDYKRIFDFLDYRYQEPLLEALNEKYNILNGNNFNMH